MASGLHRRLEQAVGEQVRKSQIAVIPAIRFLAPEFTYSPGKAVAQNHIKASRLFDLDGNLTGTRGDDRPAPRFAEVINA